MRVPSAFGIRRCIAIVTRFRIDTSVGSDESGAQAPSHRRVARVVHRRTNIIALLLFNERAHHAALLLHGLYATCICHDGNISTSSLSLRFSAASNSMSFAEP